MTHPSKRIAVVHDNLQKTFDEAFAVVATETWATNGSRPGYEDAVDRIMLPRPSASPPGVRSVDPDSLAELAAVAYATAPMVGVDAHAGQVLALHGHATDPTKFTVDLLDPTTLAVASSFDVTTATFAPFTLQNPRIALLPGAGPRWVGSTGNGSAFKVLTGAAVTATINPPDAAFPLAWGCSTDLTGRLATTWRTAGSPWKEKVIVFDTDLVTIIGEHTILNGTLDLQARAKGSTAFDPDGDTLWYYSGWFFATTTTEPAPTRRDKVYRFNVTGTTAENAEVADLGFGALVIDAGGHIHVYGGDDDRLVRQRQIPGGVRQRQIPGNVRQRQNWR